MPRIYHRWTETERHVLRQLDGRIPRAELARMFGVTVKAIENQLRCPTSQVVTLNGQPVRLAAGEYRTLLTLARRPRQVVAYAELDLNPEAARQMIRQLRRRIGDDAGYPKWIKTVRKQGYMWLGEALTAATRRALGATEPEFMRERKNGDVNRQDSANVSH